MVIYKFSYSTKNMSFKNERFFCFVFGPEYALEGKILNREFIKIYLRNKLKRVKMDSKYPLGIQSSAEDPKSMLLRIKQYANLKVRIFNVQI